MTVQILLTSGAFPRYFGGFGQTESCQPYVIATRQIFDAKHYSVTQASQVLTSLQHAWPLAQTSHPIGG